VYVCVCVCVVDKGGLPGTAAVGIAVALALTSTESATRVVGSIVPILFAADIGAVIAYRKHVDWRVIRKLLIPCGIGIAIGFSVLDKLPKSILKQLVGLVLLIITSLNFCLESERHCSVLPLSFVSESKEKDKIQTLLQYSFSSVIVGICVGFFTMVANLAGPLLVVYLLKCNLTKEVINGTRAWMFLILNVAKLPLQVYLGNLEARNFMTLIPHITLGIGESCVLAAVNCFCL
jgi:uncharacterized membrane protein YfcA